jgi:hypothetical protein
VRDNNWDLSAEVQHALTRGLSVNGGYYFNNGGYYRNTDSVQRTTDNELISPSDFDQFCVTAPSDPRLPNGGGYPMRPLGDQARRLRAVATGRQADQ